LTLQPAEAGSGVSFTRPNVEDGCERDIPADVRHVSATDLCTAVGVAGASVATIEHLMAALSALGVDNAAIEIDGPEVPVMDGSAAAFVEAIDRVGTVRLAAPRRHIMIRKPVSIRRGDSFAEFTPHPRTRVEVEIDFASRVIGRQRFAADLDAATFRREIAPARTFGFLADVEALWARGLAIGATFDNAVVIGEDRVINPGGLRFDDEFVRHKALDAVGDLALAGAPLIGCYRSYRGGHRLNVEAVAALLADLTAWTYVEAVDRRRHERAGAVGRAAVAAAAEAR
jgi:UDP-3-O-[3-hydroxymyristoyl] N-acetylglucosamine deacetylase